jgi:hypothetical protein
MDARRSRRTRDQVRRAWYAYYRQVRFARWLGFIEIEDQGDWNQVLRGTTMSCAETPQARPVTASVSDWNKPALRFASSATFAR